MTISPHPSADTFKLLNRIYGILFLFIIVLLVAASLIVSNLGHFLAETNNSIAYILKAIAIGITIVAIPVAWSYPQKLIKQINAGIPLEEKLVKYQNALLIRFVLAVFAASSVSAMFLFTGDTDLMLVLAIILLFSILSRPTTFKVAGDLNLDDEEKKQLLI
jgi:hypothetical protein